MVRAYAIAGLGYGDEGKGTTVDYLAKKIGAKVVARYNGGPQAAHHVVRDEAVHCFSQFGSGSVHLDGSGDYLTIPDSEDWNFGVLGCLKYYLTAACIKIRRGRSSWRRQLESCLFGFDFVADVAGPAGHGVPLSVFQASAGGTDSAGKGFRLYESAGGWSFECASCHDPHDTVTGNTNGSTTGRASGFFLRAPWNTICTDCHTDK